MINLNIDISDLAATYLIPKSQQDNMIEFATDEVAAAFHNAWSMQARKDLFKSRQDYINNLGVEKLGRFKTVVYLNPSAWLPNAIEHGASGFDMKQGFLKSSKVKYTAKGKPYLTIPFRLATAGSIADNPIFAGVMPKTIQNLVHAQERMPSKNKNGLPMSEIPQNFHIPESSTLRQQLKSKALEKIIAGTPMTSIYAGVKRNDKGSGYVMFRRVSLNSPQDKFQHPGLTERNLASKSLSIFEPQIPEIVGDAIRSFL